MKHSTQNRILSIFLCVLVATALLLCVFAVTNEEFAVTHDGEAVEKVTFSQNEKTEIGLQGVPMDTQLQWQIRMADGETWVNISGQTDETLTLSQALVTSIMDQTASTAVRCVASGGGAEYVTAPVTVQMSVLAASSPAYVQESVTSYGDTYLTDTASTDVAVKVHYKYLTVDGTTVFESWVANLAEGVSFQQTVNSPSTKGYKPAKMVYNGEEGNSCTLTNGTITLNEDGSVAFDLTEVTQDMEVTVIYEPELVSYTVKYYTQNVADDLYELYGTYTYSGYAGTTPDDPSNPENGLGNFDIPGFTRLYYVPETIAADGSTVFECYFDRNYYLINFDLDGGYGVAPIYARYGDTVVPGEPVRHGYVFAGWDLVSIFVQQDGQDVLVTEHTYEGVATEITYSDGVSNPLPQMIGVCQHGDPLIGNYTYRALWTTSDTTFTVVYWVQNANDDGYSYAYSISNIAAKSADVINLDNITDYKYTTDAGTEENVSKELPDDNSLKSYSTLLQDFDDNGNVVSPYTYGYQVHQISETETKTGVIVEGDGSTVFNIYFARNEYTLRFVYARSYVKDQGTEDTSDDETEYEIGRYASGYTSKDGPKADPVANGLEGANTEWVTVNGVPDVILPTNYPGEKGTFGDTYTYYYFTLKARYRQDISDLWPTTKSPDAAAFVGEIGGYFNLAWCTHADSGYANNDNNSFASISGPYQILDAEMLTSSTVSGDNVNHTLLAEWVSTGAIFWEYRYYVGITADEYEADQKSDTFDETNYIAKTDTSVPDSVENTHYYWSYWRLERKFYTYAHTSNQWYPPRTTIEGLMYTARTASSYSTTIGSTTYSGQLQTYYYYRLEYNLKFESFGEEILENPEVVNVDGYEGNGIDFGTALDGYVAQATALVNANYPSTLEPNSYEFDGWYTGPNGSGYKVIFSDTIDHDGDGVIDVNYYDTATKIWYNPTMPDDNLILFANWVPKEWTVTFYPDYDAYVGDEPYKEDWAEVHVTHDTVMPSDDQPENPTKTGYTFAGWFYYNDQGVKTAFNIHSMKVQQEMKLFAEWTSKQPVTYTVYYKLEDGTEIASATTGYSFAGYTKTFTPKIGTELDAGYQSGYFPVVSSHSILMDVPVEGEENPNTFTFYYKQKDNVTYTVKYLDADTGAELATEKSCTVKDAIVTEYAKLGTELDKVSDGKTYIPQAYSKQLILSADDDQNVITFYYVAANNTGAFIVYYHLQDLDGTTYTKQSEYYYAVVDAGTADYPTTVNALDEKYRIAFVGFTLDTNTTTTKAAYSGPIEAGKVLELNLYYSRNLYSYTVKYLIKDTTTAVKDEETEQAMYGETVTAQADAKLTYKDVQYQLVTVTNPQSLVISDHVDSNVIVFEYEPVKAALTIEVEGLPAGCTDAFLFKLVGPTELNGTDSCIELIVAIHGNGTVTIGEASGSSVLVGLYTGTYQITALTGWSYEYSLAQNDDGKPIAEVNTVKKTGIEDAPETFEINLTQATGNGLVFTYTAQGSDWLGDEAYIDNQFAGQYVPNTAEGTN